ncbi:response regulator [Nocardioides bruguierae]|uniref:Response regulator n=1 Tax=Nocardioides bruguierae TaxID=2945102 RepID=A0A9X2DAT4_9ACTN|nr:response regulator [Nocardioides bruguierae]MCM0622321.1 response regulator [Nocardioides bruguierae]
MGKLLIAEDDQDLRLLLRHVLTRAGHDVSSVADGDTALHASSVERFDLLLLDVRMPRRDGAAVLAALAARPEHQRPRVLALSGVTEEDEVDALRTLGAHDVVLKPVDQRALREAVSAALDTPRPGWHGDDLLAETA